MRPITWYPHGIFIKSGCASQKGNLSNLRQKNSLKAFKYKGIREKQKGNSAVTHKEPEGYQFRNIKVIGLLAETLINQGGNKTGYPWLLFQVTTKVQ